MNEDHNKEHFICNYCFGEVTEDNEKYVCPACGTFYHSGCWEQNYGCAVISCSQKNILLNPVFQSSVPVRDLLTHIEYFINIRKYDDALNECRRILNFDSSNLEAKVLYNRAISMIKIRDKILESAEESYTKKLYKASALFYREYLDYCDDEERKFIYAKIKYLEDLLPSMKRKNTVLHILYALILLLIFGSAGFYFYKFVYLKEETEFALIENGNDTESVKSLESQILKYEQFLSEYPGGKLRKKAMDKITELSARLASEIAKDDWRVAKIYLRKINPEENPKTYNDIEKIIYGYAASEVKSLLSDAKNLDKKKEFNEAKQKIEKCLAIIDNFNLSENNYEKKKLTDAKNLLVKKSNLLVKLNNIEREISEYKENLESLNPGLRNKELINFYCVILRKENNGFVVKSMDNRKLYLAKGLDNNLKPGTELQIWGVFGEKVKIFDDAGNEMFLSVVNISNPEQSDILSEEKNEILKKLNYLRMQKNIIDSTLCISIL